MRWFFLLVVLISTSNMSLGQEVKYLDSLTEAIINLPKQQQIEIINNVPYDKMGSDLKTYERLVNRAIDFSIELKDTLFLADSYASKTFVTNKEDALTLSLEAIRLYNKVGAQRQVAKMYTTLGWQLKHRDFNKAFSYYQKGLKILESIEDKTDIDPILDNYGVLLGMKKQWDSALYYHNKSLKIKKSLKDSVGIPFGYSHLAHVYLNRNEFEKALKYLDSSLAIRLKRNDVYGMADSYLYYGDLYFKKKDFNLATDYFEKGYQLSLKNHFFPLKKYAAELLFKSHDSLGQYKNALKYHIIYNQLKDSILNIETNNKISELEIQFQTENKEKQILTQRADLAEKELHINRKNTQIIGLIVLTMVLTLLGYLLYNQQKLKNRQLQKESELKQAIIKIETQNRLQEQRLRISRDLHDNIGAQLTFIISSLDNLKYGFKLNEKLDSKLQSISNFTSATIYELRDTIWAMNKSEISIEDLQARISNFIKKAEDISGKVQFKFDTKRVNKALKFSSVEGMNIYRIIQEAVNNAMKYSGSDKIYVNLFELNDAIQIEIKDDGCGFNVESIVQGNGLNNMKKRASEIGATLKITSIKESGTTVSLLKTINT